MQPRDGVVADVWPLDVDAGVSRPGAPIFESHRTEILARAKSVPVFFASAPAYAPTDDTRVEHWRALLENAKTPSHILYRKYGAIRKVRGVARAVLLRQGYLFANNPSVAFALANVVRLEHLFREGEIFLQRGSETLRLKRRKQGDYVYTSGPQQGKRASIWLLDRVALTREELAEPLHMDFAPLARQLGFERARVLDIREHKVLADLRYSGLWVRTALRRNGPLVELIGEELSTEERAIVDDARRLNERVQRVRTAFRGQIRTMIDERLPFDEPKTEEGQQDGKLRQHWGWAYRYGRTRYEFNEDRYRVFDLSGRPWVPQVCIDYITDTFERMSGTWYGDRGEPRERQIGRLDFDNFDMANRRSVESFAEAARSRPESFDIYEVPKERQVPLRRRKKFFATLAEDREHFQVGDVVIILGYRDDEKLHYHSFFVYESDPMTAMPTLLSSNAGHPRIRSWDNEMMNAPRRSIRRRIRPKLAWLESIVTPQEPVGQLASAEREGSAASQDSAN